jgi:RNA polymerase sigma-70 factor (ECF subfamily)
MSHRIKRLLRLRFSCAIPVLPACRLGRSRPPRRARNPGSRRTARLRPHDMFDFSFDEISPLVDRSPTAARQLASSARCRIQGAPTATNTDLTRQREVVDAFPAASRAGDFDGLLTLLDPDVVLRYIIANGKSSKSKLSRPRSPQPSRACPTQRLTSPPAIVVANAVSASENLFKLL